MSRARTQLLMIPCVLLILLVVRPQAGQATPRYSARYGQTCGLCHVNPTGGGLRTLYATQYLVPAEMSMITYTQERLASIDPQLSKNVTAGADLRTIYHRADRRDVGYDDFLQMQGTLYLAVQPDERVTLYLDRGISSTNEVYGLAYVLPFHGYIKTGRFVPAFGWKFDDHTMFTRVKPFQASPVGSPGTAADLDGTPLPGNDVGLEAGFFPGRLSLSAALVNGNRGSTADDNRKPAVLGTALYRANLDGVGLGLGGSIYRNNEVAGVKTSGGPYGYLHYRPLTWLAEFDWSNLRTIETSGAATPLPDHYRGLTVSQELTLRLFRGVELRATYNFYDPDTARPSGARSRYGAGYQVMPYPFLAFLGMVDVHHFENGTLVTGHDYTQFGVQAHFFY
jgi:hypothetical protein